MKRTMIFLAVGLLTCLTISGCMHQGAANPTEFQSEEMGFSVTFPDKPSEQKMVSNGIECTLMAVDHGDQGWTLAYIPLPKDKKGTPELLDKIVNELQKQMFEEVTATNDISTDQYIGKEIDGKSKEGIPTVIRIYLAGNVEYQLISIGGDKEKEKAFFDSFKLIDGKSDEKEGSAENGDQAEKKAEEQPAEKETE